MRAGTQSRVKHVLTAFAVTILLVGCRIPGATFGTEPMQLRFGRMTEQAIAGGLAREARPGSSESTVPPVKESMAQPIILAGHAVPGPSR